MNSVNFRDAVKYSIYVAVDSNSDEQKNITLRSLNEAIVAFCKDLKVSFSIIELVGGYSHVYGYSTERSFKIEFLNINQEIIIEIADKIKNYVGTDTVMIIRETAKSCLL